MNNDQIKNKYSSIIPYLGSERSQKFFGLVLTLCALSFFGFFAIKPTVSTILKLRKEIYDNKLVLEMLDVKIKNLTELRKQYFNIQGDLPIVMSAITTQPDAHLLFAQIQTIAGTSNISLQKLQSFEVEAIRSDKIANKDYYSYSFSVSGSGSFENISKFIKTLTNMERIINIENFSLNNIADKNQGSLGFDVQGIVFFKDNL